MQLNFDDLLNDSPLTVIDIGARGGIHPRWTRLLTNCTAVLFEPESKEFALLKKKLPPNYVLFGTALSDSRRDLTLYVCKSGGATSVYPPNAEILEHFPKFSRFEVVAEEKISAAPLDEELAESSLNRIDFIKIDTQGHELAILKGAEQTLSGVLGLEIEVEFLELYKGQCMFAEVDEYVRSKGFQLFDIRRSYWRSKGDSRLPLCGKGQLAFGDALYFRPPAQVAADPAADSNTVLKAAMVYSVYGYFRHAEKVLQLGRDAGLITAQIHDEAAARLHRFKRNQTLMSLLPLKVAVEFKERLSRILHGNAWYSGDLYPGNLFFWR